LTLRFGSGEAEFPPHPPSASPSLWTPTEFVPALAGAPQKLFNKIPVIEEISHFMIHIAEIYLFVSKFDIYAVAFAMSDF
jgi:hypothetical protein